jgi:hypothetical protein
MSLGLPDFYKAIVEVANKKSLRTPGLWYGSILISARFLATALAASKNDAYCKSGQN